MDNYIKKFNKCPKCGDRWISVDGFICESADEVRFKLRCLGTHDYEPCRYETFFHSTFEEAVKDWNSTTYDDLLNEKIIAKCKDCGSTYQIEKVFTMTDSVYDAKFPYSSNREHIIGYVSVCPKCHVHPSLVRIANTEQDAIIAVNRIYGDVADRGGAYED